MSKGRSSAVGISSALTAWTGAGGCGPGGWYLGRLVGQQMGYRRCRGGRLGSAQSGRSVLMTDKSLVRLGAVGNDGFHLARGVVLDDASRVNGAHGPRGRTSAFPDLGR